MITMAPAAPATLPRLSVPFEQLLAAVGSMAIWPVFVVVLVVVALLLIPKEQRVLALQALPDIVRAARGRETSGPASSSGSGAPSPPARTDPTIATSDEPDDDGSGVAGTSSSPTPW